MLALATGDVQLLFRQFRGQYAYFFSARWNFYDKFLANQLGQTRLTGDILAFSIESVPIDRSPDFPPTPALVEEEIFPGNGIPLLKRVGWRSAPLRMKACH